MRRLGHPAEEAAGDRRDNCSKHLTARDVDAFWKMGCETAKLFPQELKPFFVSGDVGPEGPTSVPRSN
jgi:hypothetical protein